MVREAAEKLLIATEDSSSANETFGTAAASFLHAARGASKDDLNCAVEVLARGLSTGHLMRGASLATICGALVEQGCDASPLSGPLIARLRMLLESCDRLLNACVSNMPKTEDSAEEPDEEKQRTLFDETMNRLRGQMPHEGAAWDALNTFWPASIALLSQSVDARNSAKDLFDAAARLKEHHEAGYWLWFMLSVLDQEPLLAIEPSTGLGMAGSMSGIVDNFQLHVLLMEAFPQRGFWRRRRVSRRVGDVARGVGPQETSDSVIGKWNMYTWQAIQHDLMLPDVRTSNLPEHWIWGEGRPSDIPVFEGRRVVLLGPSSYVRFWPSARIFSHLKARIDTTHLLSRDEVSHWLRRMREALLPMR